MEFKLTTVLNGFNEIYDPFEIINLEDKVPDLDQ